jgi:hypothetical protein
MAVSRPMVPVLVVTPVEPSTVLLVQREIVVLNMVIVAIPRTTVERVVSRHMGDVQSSHHLLSQIVDHPVWANSLVPLANVVLNMVTVGIPQPIVVEVVRKTTEHVLRLSRLLWASVDPPSCTERFLVRVEIVVRNMVIVGRVRPTVELVVNRPMVCVQDHRRVVHPREDRL